MRPIAAAALLMAVLVAPASGAPGGVLFSLHDGRVSIVATDATVAEILAEWAKQGRTQVMNLELTPRERITIELKDVTEEQALAVVLRRVSGYVAARREVADPELSRFDRILVMRGVAPPPLPAANVVPPASGDASGGAGADDGAGVEPDRGTWMPTQGPKTDLNVPARLTLDEPPPAQGAADPVPANRAPMTPGREHTVPSPPARGLTAGLAAARRAAAPARDQPSAPGPVDDPSQTILATGVDDGPPTPPGGVVMPPQDPAAQLAFKARRAVETVDPQTFDFKMPKAGQKATGAVGSPAGSTVPGAAAPAAPNKPGPVVIK
jgi:hypothetical protein